MMQEANSATEHEEIIGNLHMDKRLDSYQTFFDHDWAKRIFKLVKGTKLAEPVNFLAIDWRSIANAHAMPWIMTNAVTSAITGCMQADLPSTSKVVSAMHQRLARELGERVTRRFRKSLQSAMNTIASEVLDDTSAARNLASRKVRPTVAWSDFIKLEEFGFSVCGSQRLCYAGVYFAYENFVRHCTSLATGVPEDAYRTSFETQKQDMCKVFGEDTFACIVDKPVTIARHVRNALVHAGGRISGELRHIRHDLVVEDGVLRIMAPDTTALYNALRDRAFSLAECAVALPVFKLDSPANASGQEA